MNSPHEAPLPVRPGEVVAGKYRVERVLGRGGMGFVVAATHVHLEQRVALKFILPDAVGQDTQAVERFLREARAAGRLKSQHVAKVFDVGMLDDGSPYIVMEYLEGRDLGAVVESEGYVAPEVATDYLLQACEAMAEAHAAGIVHRDLKPQNLFLTEGVGGSPLIKVLDFGVSKMQTGGARDKALTSTASIVGSPMYMAPEQMRSARSADARSDIWALGVVLYTLLTGDTPFIAETMTELALTVVQDPHVPVSVKRPGVPPGLAQVVDRCLEKDPARRYPDVSDLAMALSEFAPATSRILAAHARAILNRGGERSPFLSSPSSPGGRTSDAGGPPVSVPRDATPRRGPSTDPDLAEGRTLMAPGAPVGSTSAGWSRSPRSHRRTVEMVGLAALIVCALAALGFAALGRHSRAGPESRGSEGSLPLDRRAGGELGMTSPLGTPIAAEQLAPPAEGPSTGAPEGLSAPAVAPAARATKPVGNRLALPSRDAGARAPAAPKSPTHDDDIPVLR